MDNVNLINSVAGGQVIPCPQCGTANTADSNFCISCGAKITAPAPAAAPAFAPVSEPEPVPAAPAFAPVSEPVPAAPAFAPVSEPEPVPAAAPVLAPVSEPEPAPAAATAQAFNPIAAFEQMTTKDIEEEKSVFAEGLPEWDIIPPQIMVRRR